MRHIILDFEQRTDGNAVYKSSYEDICKSESSNPDTVVLTKDGESRSYRVISRSDDNKHISVDTSSDSDWNID